MQITMRKERGAAWKHCSGQAKIFAKQKKAEETGVSWCIFNLAYLAEKRATAQHTRGERGWFKSLSDSQFAHPGKIKQVHQTFIVRQYFPYLYIFYEFALPHSYYCKTFQREYSFTIVNCGELQAKSLV